MTLTIKESVDLTSPGKPGSPSQNSENKPDQSPRSNPVCLEIPVTLRSLPGENSGEPASTGPTRQEGRTVIVFDNGAVLRVPNNPPTGQKVILSNAQGRDVVCRVVNGRNLPTIKGYIEVEFIEAVSDFWRIHQFAEPAKAAPPPVPVVALPQPPPPVATLPPQPVIAPVVTQQSEAESLSGSAPTFEDIAGLVSMTPPPTARVRTTAPAAPASAVKSNVELPSDHSETPKSAPISSALGAVPNSAPMKPTIHAEQEFSSPPIPKPTPLNDFMAKGILASAQSSTTTPSESRGRMPLIVGGLALVLSGFGAGYFLMHRGSTPAPVPSATVSVQRSAPEPSASTNGAQPAQVSPPSAEQAPAQPQPVSEGVSATSEAVPAHVSEGQPARRQVSDQEAKERDRSQNQRQQIPSLKMSAPSAPGKNSAKLPEGAAPNVTDVASATNVGGAPAGSMLSTVVRSENQPAPPSSLGAPAPPPRTVIEPKLITSTPPQYPSIARQSNAQGNVVVSADVDAKGNVLGVKAISGPTLLRQAAIDAVKQWKYSPALINGKPAAAQVTVEVQFHLN